MGDPDVCIHLREADYFDADYDITKFDARAIHWCRHFGRRIIPAHECGEICPAYCIHLAVRRRDQDRMTAQSRTVQTSNVSRDQVQRNLDKFLQRVDEMIPDLPPGVNPEELIDRIKSRKKELDEIVRESMEVTEAVHNSERAFSMRFAFEQILHRRDPDLEEIHAAHDHAKQYIRQLGERFEMLHDELQEDERLYRRLTDGAKRVQILRHLADTVRTRTEAALNACSDLPQVSEFHELDRFLEVAKEALAPGISPHYLEETVARLERMRII